MIPPVIAPKLAKLLPLLASDHDGEVVATARAIGRTLVAAGLDWHALAAALTQPASEPSVNGFDWRAAWTSACDRTDTVSQPPPETDPDAPEARSRRWGLPIWGVKKIEPWNVVAGHCLQLDWTIPKAFGGKFLTKEERARLRRLERTYAPVTNADADWIESVVTRCHAARDASRGSTGRDAA